MYIEGYTHSVTITNDGSAEVKAGKETNVHVTNTYTKHVAWEPSVKKTFDGDEDDAQQEREFTFELSLVQEPNENNDGVSMPSDATVSVNKGNDWTAAFNPVTFTKEGTYHFKITEQETNVPGYAAPAEPQTIAVVVKNNGEGQFVVESVTSDGQTDEAGFVFTNTFRYISTDWKPRVQKYLETNGHNVPDPKSFTFTLTQDSGESVLPPEHEVTIAPPYAASEEFSTVTFTKPGTYKFTIQESNDGKQGYTYDDVKYEITVVVSDSGNGTLVKRFSIDKVIEKIEGRFTSTARTPLEVEDRENFVYEFTNTYKPEPVEVGFLAHKTIIDENEVGKLTTTTLTFKLEQLLGQSEDGRFKSWVTCEEKDLTVEEDKFEYDIEFEKIELDRAGEYHFKITEIPGEAPGFSYDSTVHNVTVTVEDKDGKLEATVTYEQDQNEENPNKAYFVNTYNPGILNYIPQVAKTVEGEPTVSPRMFTFTLEEVYGSDGHFYQAREIDRVTMPLLPGQKNGTLSFGMQKYEKPGIYESQTVCV